MNVLSALGVAAGAAILVTAGVSLTRGLTTPPLEQKPADGVDRLGGTANTGERDAAATTGEQPSRVILSSPYPNNRIGTAAEEETPELRAARRNAAEAAKETAQQKESAQQTQSATVTPAPSEEVARQNGELAPAREQAAASSSEEGKQPVVETKKSDVAVSPQQEKRETVRPPAEAGVTARPTDKVTTASIGNQQRGNQLSTRRVAGERVDHRVDSPARVGARREARAARYATRQRSGEPQVGDVVDEKLLENGPVVTRRDVRRQDSADVVRRGAVREPRIGDLVDAETLARARPLSQGSPGVKVVDE